MQAMVSRASWFPTPADRHRGSSVPLPARCAIGQRAQVHIGAAPERLSLARVGRAGPFPDTDRPRTGHDAARVRAKTDAVLILVADGRTGRIGVALKRVGADHFRGERGETGAVGVANVTPGKGV